MKKTTIRGRKSGDERPKGRETKRQETRDERPKKRTYRSSDDRRETRDERGEIRDKRRGLREQKTHRSSLITHHSDAKKRTYRSSDDRRETITGRRETKRQETRDERPKKRTYHSEKPRRTFRSEKPVTCRASRVTKKSDDVRLNKFIANSGICSRREADEYISAGLVTVNGQVVTEMGVKVKPGDDIRFNGERMKGEQKVYIVMNKPKDYVTTMGDPYATDTVMDLIGDKCPQRVYPVGRLDKSTTGVLLFTNDGEMAEQLTHPSYNKKKVYHVFLDKNLKATDFQQLLQGVKLEDGMAQADSLSYVDGDHTQLGLEIHSGRNRIVRRMFETLGYKVKKLDRVYFAGITKKWRFLAEAEVTMLKMGSYE